MSVIKRLKVLPVTAVEVCSKKVRKFQSHSNKSCVILSGITTYLKKQQIFGIPTQRQNLPWNRDFKNIVPHD